MARIVTSHEPGSDEWLEQRAARLGGSEIAAVLGLSPYESPLSLWLRKANLIGPKPDNEEMEWGRRLEAAVLAKWAENHRDTHGLDELGTTWLHDTHDWMLASPDALAFTAASDYLQREVVEIKTALFGDEWGEPGTDEVPPYYLTQARWYLGVLDLQVCHLAVLIGGHDYREYRIQQNPDDLALMMREGREFLDSIAADQRPAIDGSNATYQAVRQLHPEIDLESIDLPPDLGDAYVAAITAHKTAEDAKREQTSRVLDHMGRAKDAWHNGRKVATRQARGEGHPYLVAARNLAKHTTTRAKEAA